MRDRQGCSALLFAAIVLTMAGCAKDAPPVTEDPAVAREEAPDQPVLTVPAQSAAVAVQAPPSSAAPSAAEPVVEIAPTAAPAPVGAAAAPVQGAAAAPAALAATASAAVAVAEPPKVENVTSSAQGSDGFSVWLQGPGKQKVGQQGQVEVVLVAKGDFHCNDNYPYKFKLGAPGPGVSYPQPVVRREGLSLTPARAVMRIPFVPTEVGETKIAGRFSFSVCTSAQCVVDSRDLAVSVTVE